MLLFTFLLIDSNKDGFLTPEDLVEFLGAKR